MIAWLAAILLALAPAAAPPPGKLSGTYQTRQMEVGAMLELKTDGSFRYMLDYGSVSEAAEGSWSTSPEGVVLNSKPMPIELLREIERSDAAFDEEPLILEDGTLVMQRYDTIFTFYRNEP
jgi:hypothetical protein